MKRTVAVFVHGWAGSADSWRPIIDKLDPARWQVSALRLPGSRGGKGRATVAAAADQLVSLLEEMPAPAVLVGHSMGAQVTLLAHARVPRLVASEVVIDPAYAGDAGSGSAMALWAAQIEQNGLPAVADFFASATVGMSELDTQRVLTDLHETLPSVIASYLRSEYVDIDAIGLDPATAVVARNRRAPVLSLHSTPEGVRREASLPHPPGSAAELWQGTGHYLHLEDPDRFVSTLDAWRDLRRSDPSPFAPNDHTRVVDHA